MPTPAEREIIADNLRAASEATLPGHMGLELVEIGVGTALMRCELKAFHLAPNGYLHAGTVITLADTAAGYGCVSNLPDGSSGFTTIELKTNFLGTVLQGAIRAEATMLHGGRTTQVWDVLVTAEGSGKPLAQFRCTQMLLYPQS